MDRLRKPAVAHLIPYQGSKRRLAASILALCGERRFARLIEPFAGSAAVTIAAAELGVAQRYVIGDSLRPLAEILRLCIAEPTRLADAYERHWSAQQADPRAYYAQARARFNADRDPATLLYLLARCVKNAPRFARDGSFNQSADHRRLGRKPAVVRRAATAISALLKGRSEVVCSDFSALCDGAEADDLVYLDPPWIGTTEGRDKRYRHGLPRRRLIPTIRDLVDRNVPLILSYDGRTGSKQFGAPLPTELGLLHLEIDAGRSSQATLLGRNARTVESVYVSKPLHDAATAALRELGDVRIAGAGHQK